MRKFVSALALTVLALTAIPADAFTEADFQKLAAALNEEERQMAGPEKVFVSRCEGPERGRAVVLLDDRTGRRQLICEPVWAEGAQNNIE
jgi:hypothetical protein